MRSNTHEMFPSPTLVDLYYFMRRFVTDRVTIVPHAVVMKVQVVGCTVWA